MWLRSEIALLLSLGSSALAQGSVGGVQSSCANAGPWIYRGCFGDGFGRSELHAAFNWQLSSMMTSTNYYPGYAGAITVTFCQQACRGHGFRFAALYTGSVCYCATRFPNPFPPSSGSTTSGPGALPANTNANAAVDDGFCKLSKCLGNIAQSCGGPTYAAVYEDPSFSSDTSLQSATYYSYLGCYQVVSPGNMFAVIKTPSTISCETYCGQLGYPFIARTGINTDTGTTCGCGTEIQAGYQLEDSQCQYPCNIGDAP